MQRRQRCPCIIGEKVWGGKCRPKNVYSCSKRLEWVAEANINFVEIPSDIAIVETIQQTVAVAEVKSELLIANPKTAVKSDVETFGLDGIIVHFSSKTNIEDGASKDSESDVVKRFGIGKQYGNAKIYHILDVAKHGARSDGKILDTEINAIIASDIESICTAYCWVMACALIFRGLWV